MNLIETNLVVEKLEKEIAWLKMALTTAPEGLQVKLQTLIDKRKVALDSVFLVDVTVPEAAKEFA